MWSVFTLCKLFYLELHVSWGSEWMEEVTCARVRAQHRPPWQQQAAPTLTKWRGQPGAGTRAALGQRRSCGTFQNSSSSLCWPEQCVDTPAIEASRTAATCSTEPLNPDTTHYMPGIAHFTPSIHKVVLLSMDINTHNISNWRAQLLFVSMSSLWAFILCLV